MQQLLADLDRAGRIEVSADQMTRAECQRLVDAAREQHAQQVEWDTAYRPIPGLEAEGAVFPVWTFTVRD